MEEQEEEDHVQHTRDDVVDADEAEVLHVLVEEVGDVVGVPLLAQHGE